MSLSAKVLENLRVFGSFPLAEFEKLLSITILELCKGIHQLNIEALGEKYGLDTEILQESLDSLVFTILHLVRMDVSQEIITTVINPLYLPIEYIQEYEKCKEEIMGYLGEEESEKSTHFEDLEWRFDMQLGNKLRYETLAPKFILNLKLLKEGEGQNLLLESNYANMKRIGEELQSAISSLNLPYSRKLLKFVK